MVPDFLPVFPTSVPSTYDQIKALPITRELVSVVDTYPIFFVCWASAKFNPNYFIFQIFGFRKHHFRLSHTLNTNCNSSGIGIC